MMTLKKLLCLSVVTCSICVGLTGCGNNDNGSTSGNNDNNIVGDTANNVGNAAEDLAEGAGNAVGDVADGVGNAVDDLVGTNGFDNYDDARKYFLETMESYHADAQFELRDEERDLEDYQEGSKGYRFELYDTSKNEKGEFVGEFYVDANTGVIYRDGDDDQVIEYRGIETDNNTSHGNTAKKSGTANDNANDANSGTNGTNNGNENAGDANGGNTSGGNGNAGNTNGGNAATTR